MKWFDRKFEFSFDENIFPSILERLNGTAILLNHKINNIPAEHLTTKLNGKWSIQENIGHLLDLEPIWQGRLDDILTDKQYLRPADLENKKTDLAHHNDYAMEQILHDFTNTRQKLTDTLETLSEAEIYKHALHPRLKTPMRTMDLFLFVAEHDDHHLSTISNIYRQLTTNPQNR